MFWTVYVLGELVNCVFLEVTEFREWYRCMYVYERVYKCVHKLISGNFTRFGSQSQYRVILILPYNIVYFDSYHFLVSFDLDLNATNL